jgi:hypothetical protein
MPPTIFAGIQLYPQNKKTAMARNPTIENACSRKDNGRKNMGWMGGLASPSNPIASRMLFLLLSYCHFLLVVGWVGVLVDIFHLVIVYCCRLLVVGFSWYISHLVIVFCCCELLVVGI